MSEVAPKTEGESPPADQGDSESPPAAGLAQWAWPVALILLTTLSTSYVGAAMHGLDALQDPGALLAGWDFALPLMAILLSHELGHYLVGRRHGVDISPPYFIPLPFALGTMGAVISIRSRIKDRNALLDVGAAGPIAGLVVAIPVLAFGLWQSKIDVLSSPAEMEGRSILYLALLYLIKGPIPDGYDVWLSPTALAGWVGLLVTMMNLLPYGQLDGGHIAYALFGKVQDRISRWVLVALPVVAVLSGLGYGALAALEGHFDGRDLLAGAHWVAWFVVLQLLTRLAGAAHPPFDPGELTPARRAIAVGMLILFVLLFMPSWMRTV